MPKNPDTLWVDASEAASLIDYAVRTRLLMLYPSYQAAAQAWFSEDSGNSGKRLERTLDEMDRGVVKRAEELVQGAGHSAYLVDFFESLRSQAESVSVRRQTTGRYRLRKWSSALGSLVSVRQQHRSEDLAGSRLSPERFADLTSAGPARTNVEVLLRGQAMVSWLEAMRNPRQLKEVVGDSALPPSIEKFFMGITYEDRVMRVLDDLLTITCLPLSQGAPVARILAAKAGEFATSRLRDHIWNSPMGWRTVRIITECLRLLTTGYWQDDPDRMKRIEATCRSLLQDIDTEDPTTLYRARSFWEEAAAAAPLSDKWDWLVEVLIRRAVSGKPQCERHEFLPVRERSYAAQVAWLRIARFPSGASEAISDERVRQLIVGLTAAAQELSEPGLTYTASYLEFVANGGLPLYVDAEFERSLNPDRGRELLSVERVRGSNRPADSRLRYEFWEKQEESTWVAEALKSPAARAILAKIPVPSRPGLRILVIQSCLTIDGLWRRNSLETMLAAGVRDQAAGLYLAILEVVQSRGRTWLVEQVTFCLGFLGGPIVIDHMLDFLEGADLSPGERVAALVALGDHAKEIGKRENDALRLFDKTMAVEQPVPVRRALVYALAMLRSGSLLSRRLLASSMASDDEYESSLAQWGMARVENRVTLQSLCAECGSSPNDLRRIVPPFQSADGSSQPGT